LGEGRFSLCCDSFRSQIKSAPSPQPSPPTIELSGEREYPLNDCSHVLPKILRLRVAAPKIRSLCFAADGERVTVAAVQRR
jgi:hypothetical protein